MSNLEKIYNRLGELGKSILSLMKIAVLHKKIPALNKLCFNPELVILGNGPSLKKLLKQDTEFLNGKDKMAVNFASLSDDFKIIKPEYYLLMDPAFFTDEKNRDKAIGSMVEKVDWEMILFVSSYALRFSDWQKMIASNKNIKIQPFNPTPIEGIRNINFFLYDLALGMPRPRNVLVACLMTALQQLPYKTIWLGGADHSWLQELWVDDENRVHEDLSHFYDKGNPHTVILDRPLYKTLEGMCVAFKSYLEVEDYSKKRGVKIYNITEGSYIDAFERRKVDK
ncbi:MAG: hypothetical protein Q4F97_09865 [Bacteroidales bacterium]|nr:hypothetical protein [Bacteroidales bacterium]